MPFTLAYRRRKIGKLHLLAAPRELVMVIQRGMREPGLGRYYLWWRTKRKKLFSSTSILKAMRAAVSALIDILQRRFTMFSLDAKS